jgi:hypothetical protein
MNLLFSALKGRKSTLIYEIAKGLDLPSKPNKELLKEKKLILNMNGCCEYCGVRVKKSAAGDHFYALIKDGMPTEYCNDICNKIPACSACNSSKGGKHWRDWLLNSELQGNPLRNMDEIKRTALLDKLTRYDKFMQQNCRRKRYDNTVIKTALQSLMKEVDETIKYMNENANVEFYTLKELEEQEELDNVIAGIANVSV